MGNLYKEIAIADFQTEWWDYVVEQEGGAVKNNGTNMLVKLPASIQGIDDVPDALKPLYQANEPYIDKEAASLISYSYDPPPIPE